MNTNGERAYSLYTPDTWHTVRIRRKQWSSLHATVPIHSARITASAASALIWSVVEPNYTIAMRALAEGNSLRGTSRIVDVDKDTVCTWLDQAGRHCRAVTAW